MARTLVVCFSRTGHTQGIADRVAKSLGADLEVITEKHSRRGIIGYLRSGWQASRHFEPRIEASRFDPFEYDLVVIGTPIWNFSLSSPVRSYLSAHKGAFKEVAYFCTCGGRGDAKVFAQMTAVTGRLPQATLTIREAELDKPDLATRIDAFTSKLKQRAARAA